MLTHEQNERLTRVGPGTPGGALLRRYWQAVCPTMELAYDTDRKRVRLLAEDLLIYRDAQGTYRCVHEQYPHQGIALAAYPIEALGGLLFVYMGPHPEHPPLLPRWDVLAREDKAKRIRIMPEHHCNWVQIQENTADSVHTYYLHGHRVYQMNGGKPDRAADYFYRPIKAYDWKVSSWGVEKFLEYGGERPEVEIRPPLIFPNVLRIPEGPIEALHFRVPIDDEHTRIIWVGLFEGIPGGEPTPPDRVPYAYEFDAPGTTVENVDLSTFYGQDRVVWETQGAIADRSIETLGASDRGIVLFRRMLAEQIDRVERGDEPNVAVVTDPAQNVSITFDTTLQWAEVGT
jgi:5,5'-dehydrodivanillate O-demethylase